MIVPNTSNYSFMYCDGSLLCRFTEYVHKKTEDEKNVFFIRRKCRENLNDLVLICTFFSFSSRMLYIEQCVFLSSGILYILGIISNCTARIKATN